MQKREPIEVTYKDPAALIYVANFLLLVKKLRPHEIGWLTLLALHQYWDDERSLPDDIDELGSLCNVRMSEAETFKRCWKETFERMFERRPNGRLFSNDLAGVIKSRKDTENQSNNNNKSGRVSFFTRELREKYTQDENLVLFLKKQVDFDKETNINAAFVKETFERCSNLYKKVSINTNINSDINQGVQGEELTTRTMMQYKFNFENDYPLDEKVVAENKFTPDNLAQARLEFWNSKELDDELLENGYKDVQKHFLNWCRKNAKRIKETKYEQGISKRNGADTNSIVAAAKSILQSD